MKIALESCAAHCNSLSILTPKKFIAFFDLITAPKSLFQTAVDKACGKDTTQNL